MPHAPRAHQVGFFMHASPDIYALMRRRFPPHLELVTLETRQPAEPLEKAARLDVLIAGRVTAALMDAAPRLRLIQTPGVGTDGVDLEAARGRGIPVAANDRGITEEVAEHTFALMLAVSKRVVELANAAREGRWLMWQRRLACRTLAGRTLGILGMGRIGRAVARRAAAFDMNVQYHDLEPRGDAPAGARFVDERELLATSDVLSLHLPLLPETRGWLDRERLGRMKPGAILVNTARGEVVDEGALHAALAAGHLLGAGLDVLAAEPPDPRNPLLALDAVVVTPHTGSGTLESAERKADFYAENADRVLRGEPPLGRVA
jgi:phosphoglycerate dehydrogenase-like enzyme